MRPYPFVDRVARLVSRIMFVIVRVVGFGRSYRVTLLADPFLTSIAEVIRLRRPVADVTILSGG